MFRASTFSRIADTGSPDIGGVTEQLYHMIWLPYAVSAVENFPGSAATKASMDGFATQ